MANVFNSVKGLHPKRNAFSAHTYRNDFTAYMGLNIPVYQQHVVAGTRVKVDASALVRLQALISPIMDNVDYYVHFWQLPYRLIENDRFTQFFSGEIEPEEYTGIFLTPNEFANSLYTTFMSDYGNANKFKTFYDSIIANGGLLDFLGYDFGLFPVFTPSNNPFWSGGNDTTKLNFRPLIAYYMLHENWYMNENVPYFDDFVELVKDLVKEQSVTSLARLLIGTFNMQGYSFLPHGWDKDYFTSALPNVQYGDPVTLPIAGSAPVTIDPDSLRGPLWFGQTDYVETVPIVAQFDEGTTADDVMKTSTTSAQGRSYLKADEGTTLLGLYAANGLFTGDERDITGEADLSEASAITINELRFANALQVFKERQMRFGRRRLEFYKGFFDVVPEDLRLQVPKYLGGGRIPINIADIEQTSATTGSGSSTQALGHLAGKGTAVAGGFAGFTTFCSEESIIIGIAFVMPHQTYAQSISKFLMKTNDIYDYFNPSFEHLGEQPILNVELYAGTDDPDGEFGYTPRYNEYRFHNNEMHGDFKGSLAYWTLGRIFDSTPALNADFVYMQPAAFNRIFAVANQPNLLCSMLFRTRIIQPVSKYGTPMLLA